MKHFIYMNTEILNSYISQFDNGLVVGNHQEITDTTQEIKENSTTHPQDFVEGKLNLGIFSGNARTNGESIKEAVTLTQSEAGRELIDKILHDDSFNKFYRYIKENDKIKDEDKSKVGDYIEKKEKFKFWDLDYLIEAFSDKNREYIINMSLKSEIASLMLQGKKINSNEKNNMRKAIKEPVDLGMEMIKLCNTILPYSKFMTTNNSIIPINERFLREEIKAIRFKYDGKLNLIGRYTGNYLKEDNDLMGDSQFQSVFKTLDEVSLTFIKDVIGIDEKSRIIEPIALYLE
ncbi:MAG: hypothetical protein E6094_10755 [Clostridium perfringens]|nr:hypothetical protein [Clostridium perfringens]